MLYVTVLFHLDPCSPSLARAARGDVVRRWYRPLLALLDRVPGMVLALEAPLHALERIDSLDPEWNADLARLVTLGQVEFVGSGDSRLIGPLVPECVHVANQRLGVEGYAARFGAPPRVALVNELAFSQGIVDGYLDAGYEALIVEWNSARRIHPEWSDELGFRPALTRSPRGRPIAVLWVDAVGADELQRAVRGPSGEAQDLAWLGRQVGDSDRHVCLYVEPELEPGEWQRLTTLLLRASEAGVVWTTPSGARRVVAAAPEELTLATGAEPILVEHRPGYNVARWAVSGRNDLSANATCQGEAYALASTVAPLDRWRGLCRRWASHLRTDATEEQGRGSAAVRLRRARRDRLPEAPARPSTCAAWRLDGRRVLVETDGVSASLLLDYGLAFESVAFRAHGGEPAFGTLPMGTFDDIDWAADFYSGHLAIGVPGAGRVTDLDEGPLEVQQLPEGVSFGVRVTTALGTLTKRVFVAADSVRVAWDLAALGPRPRGSVRLCAVTLLDDAFGERLFATTSNGGARERYRLSGEIDQAREVAPLVTSRGGYGAVDGRFVLDDGQRGLELSWDPTRAPAMPLLQHLTIGRKRFCRVSLSLGELDDTFREGGTLPAFEIVVRGFARAPRPATARWVGSAS
ncbi:MAG: hypothetical protein WD226_00915 [Planctomycetota bacterium]